MLHIFNSLLKTRFFMNTLLAEFELTLPQNYRCTWQFWSICLDRWGILVSAYFSFGKSIVLQRNFESFQNTHYLLKVSVEVLTKTAKCQKLRHFAADSLFLALASCICAVFYRFFAPRSLVFARNFRSPFNLCLNVHKRVWKRIHCAYCSSIHLPVEKSGRFPEK